MHAFLRLAASAALALAVAVAAAGPAAAQTAAPAEPRFVVASGGSAGEMTVPVDKSQVLTVDRPFTDILVGNPEIADVVPLSDRSVYVLGKGLGSTNLTIYGPGRDLLAVIDLVITHDAEGLKQRLFDVLPGEDVEVRGVAGGLVLSGTVGTARALERAVAMAERYAPGAVTNLLSVAGSQQVMLSVKVAEVRRSLARGIGIKPTVFGEDFFVDVLDPLDITRFLGADIMLTASEFAIDLLIDALEEKGAVRVLAEPNLIALSGDTATFLAGGEFPIPVAQEDDEDGSTITVVFKQFGVSLAFTPTVLDGDLINLSVAPEVSQIDPTTSVRISGFTIPGLSTRRARTTVELRDGQSFAIAGLLQSDFTDQVRQVPGLGDIPILGALARSSEFQRSETELVIIVTPHLVQPAPPGLLAAPTDSFVPPSDAELFLFGQVEGSDPAALEVERQVLSARPGGGISGPYGHILK
ncbi:type II and III secretion system protein family protein [Caenispirillum bisanense]|uniref:Pilus assembly protein CpaC n=1 Tax=Caenispirillum bisanense TaxID=414052 RepID=A0A286GD89_9PROT|nr:type II and III secretion system protein family protein [Caenispirillum bisanense]SOD93493.1 pilus assembly protein CpaC [Caenispirillum bisanense]